MWVSIGFTCKWITKDISCHMPQPEPASLPGLRMFGRDTWLIWMDPLLPASDHGFAEVTLACLFIMCFSGAVKMFAGAVVNPKAMALPLVFQPQNSQPPGCWQLVDLVRMANLPHNHSFSDLTARRLKIKISPNIGEKWSGKVAVKRLKGLWLCQVVALKMQTSS